MTLRAHLLRRARRRAGDPLLNAVALAAAVPLLCVGLAWHASACVADAVRERVRR